MDLITAFSITQPLSSLGRNNDAPDNGDAPDSLSLEQIVEFISEQARTGDSWWCVTEALTGARYDLLSNILEAIAKADDAALGKLVREAVVEYVEPFALEELR